jgi:hypothetical protein
VLAHIIFQAVYLARVAFARATIELAFFDLILLAGVIWPKPKDPCFSFFENLLHCIELRWLLARVCYMQRACESLSVVEEAEIQWASGFLDDSEEVTRAAKLNCWSNWELHLRFVLMKRFQWVEEDEHGADEA